MSHPRPVIFGVLCLVASLIAASSFESVYEVSIADRRADLLAARRPQPSDPGPLDLRLVDSGGVGIPLDGWGKDYSHDRRIFRNAILERAPYVDAAAFERIEHDWRVHVERMVSYGNNAIAVPLLLELIDFDRLAIGTSPPGSGVYDAGSAFRARHDAVRRHFGPLFEWTRRRGMRVFLEADMLTVTPPLLAHLRRLAPAATSVGVDASDPKVWEVYRAGLEELFVSLPAVDGLVIRFGEGGNLYNTAGWPYRSEMAVRTAASVRAMLRGLLPVFERTGRTLVLRSWTVGIGPVGRLHIDPEVYDEVLGDIDSPALIVSTKFTAGDFFSYLPLNPTLAGGRHRRLVELQAKPEFEGFTAFPNFLGEEHARALRSLRAANPRIAGAYVLTQFGGPLRAGPRTLYPLHGFWVWTDANVFVASRLAADPSAAVEPLAREWAARMFGDDARLVDAVTRALIVTRDAVRKGFYVRPFAEREVRVPGLELPPLMWIFEWDMVGGWHSLLSLVYQGSRDRVDVAIAEGNAAASAIGDVRRDVQAAFAAAAPGTCRHCPDALRSLEYQESLFEVLAAWRQTFLSYYRWLETGDSMADSAWRAGRRRFETAAALHAERFGDDLEFPAFDLTSAQQAIAIAARAPVISYLAIALVATIAVLLALGSPLVSTRAAARRLARLSDVGRLVWTSVVVPWRLDLAPVERGAAVTVSTLALVVVGFLAGTLTGFATPWIGAGSVFLFATVACAFESTATDPVRHRDRGRLLVAAVGPLLPGAMILLGLIAYVGPLGFWYWFWTSAAFRVIVLTIIVAMLLWAGYVMLAVRIRDGWPGRLGGGLVAAGAGLVTLTALLPDWAVALRFLDRPLNLAPATETMLFALQTYAGVGLHRDGQSYVFGALCLAAGYTLWLRSARRRFP